MRNPPPIYRNLFIVSVGFLFVGMLFTMVGWPADELFSIIGGTGSLVLYFPFSYRSTIHKRSVYPRHVVFTSLAIGQIAKSFDLVFGTYFFLLALVSLLVWVVWSVLEDLPPSED